MKTTILRQRMTEDMQVRNLSRQTQASYSRPVRPLTTLGSFRAQNYPQDAKQRPHSAPLPGRKVDARH
jgi:hypothetical protein